MIRYVKKCNIEEKEISREVRSYTGVARENIERPLGQIDS